MPLEWRYAYLDQCISCISGYICIKLICFNGGSSISNTAHVYSSYLFNCKIFSVDRLEQSFSVFRLGQSIICTCLFVLMWMLFI